MIPAKLFLVLQNGMHMSRGDMKWRDAFHAVFMTRLCESTSQGVDWGVSQTFLNISRFTALSLSLSPGDPSLSTQEALSPVLGRGEDTAGPHQHEDTGGLCDGQLRVWNRSHLIAWKRWPPTASKQTESLSPVAWPTSRWKIPLGCSKARYFMGRSWFILVIQLGT